MSETYKAISWNRQKLWYDGIFVTGFLIYLVTFAVATIVTNPTATPETIIMRGFGTLAFVSLHIILLIGPLSRIDSRFLPLLYNRRHLGVATFLMALVHAVLVFVQYHSFGDMNPLSNLFGANTRFTSVADFPFQLLGFGALIVLFLMAATSHDFWLRNLTAPVWKALHMGVYVAYALLVGHVVLGVLQSESSPWMVTALAAGVLILVVTHIVAGIKERATDGAALPVEDGFVRVCAVDEIPENRACIGDVSGERVAVFKYEGKVSAVSNVCQHQNGPLGEGEIIDGCITCPWHGFQYEPETGASPPPFTEKIPTFEVEVRDGEVWVNEEPKPAGTKVEAVRIKEDE